MDQFNYRDGRLHCEEVAVEEIAAAAGTPVYIYSAATITDHYRKLVAAFKRVDPLICYSIKSCSNLSILRLLADLGAGMDVVSGGELFRAGLAKVHGHGIVYAGVGKTDEEIIEALDYSPEGSTRHGIRLFNIESEAEFENIASLARARGVVCEATLRVNPDVDPKTHVYTTTGKKETKFGVDLERARSFFRKYGRNEHCRLTAIHLHIGSPVYTVEPYIEAVKRALALIDELAAEGFKVTALNLGGGFGADYTSAQSPVAADYASAIVPLLHGHVDRGLKIILEPGRSIIANAGILLTRVQYLKKSGQRHFVIIDGGMHTLIRPALYGSFHFIWPARVARPHVPVRREQEMDLPGLDLCDVVGPICESSDFLAKDRRLPPLVRGDLLAVFSAGAYGMVMASHYNSHPLPAEVLVSGSRATTVRSRETYDDLVAREREATLLLGRDED